MSTTITTTTTKKPYPLGLDNPFIVRARIGTTKWEIIDRESRHCLGVYPNQTTAYECRRAMLRYAGYEV
jgi:hypothetical protein